MTTEQIRTKLLQLHRQENELNKKIAKADCIVRGQRKEILRFAKLVSLNMKYRNQLIKQLQENEKSDNSK